MTVLITCSSPLPSTIISPVLNSFKNCVPVPVNTPPAVNTDAPDIIFTLSTGILAVKFLSALEAVDGS